MADSTSAERTSISNTDEQRPQPPSQPATTTQQPLPPQQQLPIVAPPVQVPAASNWFSRIATGPPVGGSSGPRVPPLRTQMSNTTPNQFQQSNPVTATGQVPTPPQPLVGHQLGSSPTTEGVSITSPSAAQLNASDLPVLRLECRTWSRDSHELYDYESQNYHEKGYYVKRAARVFRHGTEIFVLPENAELPTTGEFLVSVRPRDNRYCVFPADKTTVSGSANVNVRKLWLITKFLKNERYALQENDVVKLWRFKLKIRQVVTDANADVGIDYKLDDRENYSAEELSQEQAESTQCRICLLEGAEENDPLIRACKCKGSIMYVHLECLRHWVNGRLNLTDDSNRACCFVRQLPCELCKETFPSFVMCRGKKVSIVKIPKIDPPFIVLENMVGPANRGLHLCSLSAKKECKLGRGHESDVRIADVSISRWHATIKFIDGRFQLEDQLSKFGTLVALRHPIIINDELSVQVGRTVLKFSVAEDPPAMRADIIKFDTRQETWPGKSVSGGNPPSEGPGSGTETARQPLPLGNGGGSNNAGGNGGNNLAGLPNTRARGFYVPIRPQSGQQEDEPGSARRDGSFYRLPTVNIGAPPPCGVIRINEADFVMDWGFADGSVEAGRQSPIQRQQLPGTQQDSPTQQQRSGVGQLNPTCAQSPPVPGGAGASPAVANILTLRFVSPGNSAPGAPPSDMRQSAQQPSSLIPNQSPRSGGGPASSSIQLPLQHWPALIQRASPPPATASPMQHPNHRPMSADGIIEQPPTSDYPQVASSSGGMPESLLASLINPPEWSFESATVSAPFVAGADLSGRHRASLDGRAAGSPMGDYEPGRPFSPTLSRSEMTMVSPGGAEGSVAMGEEQQQQRMMSPWHRNPTSSSMDLSMGLPPHQQQGVSLRENTNLVFFSSPGNGQVAGGGAGQVAMSPGSMAGIGTSPQPRYQAMDENHQQQTSGTSPSVIYSPTATTGGSYVYTMPGGQQSSQPPETMLQTRSLEEILVRRDDSDTAMTTTRKN